MGRDNHSPPRPGLTGCTETTSLGVRAKLGLVTLTVPEPLGRTLGLVGGTAPRYDLADVLPYPVHVPPPDLTRLDGLEDDDWPTNDAA